jgi:hypothetical protein
MISTSKFTSVSIEEGLDLILSHLEPPYFPRRISTDLTERNPPWQILVNSRDETLARFKQSNLLNCRISAYKYPVPTIRGINAQYPNFVMPDLDRKDFKTDKSLQECLQQTLENFKVKLHGASPTVLWSGGGYHILQPLDADIVLEMESIFNKFNEPSRGLVRYAERLMTDDKADSAHSNNISFGNCMVRIPGSYNTKYTQFNKVQSEVKIVQQWDGYRPDIKWILRDYWICLTQENNNEILDGLRRDRRVLRSRWKRGIYRNQRQHNKIGWIESLYRRPLDDFRKCCIWKIFAPYFINIRMLSQSEAFDLIKDWLDRCNLVKRLDFNPTTLIKSDLRGVGTFQPIGPHKLRIEIPKLYTRLKGEGII